MKICFITPYPPKQGGLSTYSKRIVDYLSNQPKIEVSVLPFNSFLDIQGLFTIPKQKFDVVRLEYNIPAYGFSSFPLFFILMFLRLLTKTVFVVNFHEIKRETDMLGGLGTLFFQIFSLPFHKIYVHTLQAKQILELKCHLNPKKIFTVPHGTSQFKDKTSNYEEIKSKYKLNNKKIVLYFGYIHPDKGIEYLLKAIKQLKVQDPATYSSLQIIIAGDIRTRMGLFKYFEKKDIAYKSYLIDLTEKLGIKKTVRFIGFIEQKYIYSLLSSAHLIVFPYTKVEQSGVLNMVLPLSVPIIASNIGGLKETLSETGVLVNTADFKGIATQISILIKDKAYYKKISASYKSLASKLQVSHVTRCFLNTLNPI